MAEQREQGWEPPWQGRGLVASSKERRSNNVHYEPECLLLCRVRALGPPAGLLPHLGARAKQKQLKTSSVTRCSTITRNCLLLDLIRPVQPKRVLESLGDSARRSHHVRTVEP